MSLIARELRDVWDALRATNGHRGDALTEVRIRKLRGIRDLRLPFAYPVSVLAGPNGCGKSTVLFSCASAYDAPERASRDLTPGSLFPDFNSRQPGVSSDARQPTTIEFHYRHRGDRVSMTWTRGRSWKRSFTNSNGGQPERPVYLRTLANLTNPSEVRGVLQLGRKPVETEEIAAGLLIFAHRILPRRYRNLTIVSGSESDLLFAEIEGPGEASYSEFHMSSGERSILRISKDTSRLENALVLIDEIDTGLHPYTQQQAMLELQRSALRQNLQIVVATHSPVVLDSVPPEARIFLDRDESTGQVRRAPPHRDIFQKALYGSSGDRLSILCEDAVAEGVIRGVLDVLNIELGLLHGDVVIGRNTGRDAFQNHVRTLAKFHKLSDFILVLDGDSRSADTPCTCCSCRATARRRRGCGASCASGRTSTRPDWASRRRISASRWATWNGCPRGRATARRGQGRRHRPGRPARTQRPGGRPDHRAERSGKERDSGVAGGAEDSDRPVEKALTATVPA